MKTIGLIGGMSWESSQEYYRIINEETQKRLGGLHSAKVIMVSFDFAEIGELQRAGKWEEATSRMVSAAQTLENGGADFVLICTNTMHKMATEVQQSIDIPLLHIADSTASVISSRGISKVGLLGTRYTMEQDFYKERLCNGFGLEVLVPEESERTIVHDVIFDELCLGNIKEGSRKAYLEIINKLSQRGAQGIVLGCTEIDLLIQEKDTPLPVFDTTRIHAEAAVALALQ